MWVLSTLDLVVRISVLLLLARQSEAGACVGTHFTATLEEQYIDSHAGYPGTGYGIAGLCQYNITAETGFRVQLYFDPSDTFQVEESSDCSSDSLSLGDTGLGSIYPYSKFTKIVDPTVTCGNVAPSQTITSSTEELMAYFVGSGSGDALGFRMYYKAVPAIPVVRYDTYFEMDTSYIKNNSEIYCNESSTGTQVYLNSSVPTGSHITVSGLVSTSEYTCYFYPDSEDFPKDPTRTDSITICTYYPPMNVDNIVYGSGYPNSTHISIDVPQDYHWEKVYFYFNSIAAACFGFELLINDAATTTVTVESPTVFYPGCSYNVSIQPMCFATTWRPVSHRILSSAPETPVITFNSGSANLTWSAPAVAPSYQQWSIDGGTTWGNLSADAQSITVAEIDSLVGPLDSGLGFTFLLRTVLDDGWDVFYAPSESAMFVTPPVTPEVRWSTANGSWIWVSFDTTDTWDWLEYRTLGDTWFNFTYTVNPGYGQLEVETGRKNVMAGVCYVFEFRSALETSLGVLYGEAFETSAFCTEGGIEANQTAWDSSSFQIEISYVAYSPVSYYSLRCISSPGDCTSDLSFSDPVKSVTGLTAGTIYNFELHAFNGATGYSRVPDNTTANFHFCTSPSAPTDFTQDFASTGKDSAMVEWTYASGSYGFRTVAELTVDQEVTYAEIDPKMGAVTTMTSASCVSVHLYATLNCTDVPTTGYSLTVESSNKTISVCTYPDDGDKSSDPLVTDTTATLYGSVANAGSTTDVLFHYYVLDANGNSVGTYYNQSTPFTIPDTLDSCTMYNYVITPVYMPYPGLALESSPSSPFTFTTAPTTPVDATQTVNASYPTDSAIHIKVTNVGFTGPVDFYIDPLDGSQCSASPTSVELTADAEITGLSAGCEYTFAISNDCSPSSSPNITRNFCTAPVAVSSLDIATCGRTTARFSWSGTVPSGHDYAFYASHNGTSGGGSYTLLTDLKALSGLDSGTAYNISVKTQFTCSTGEVFESATLATTSFTTGGDSPPTVVVVEEATATDEIVFTVTPSAVVREWEIAYISPSTGALLTSEDDFLSHTSDFNITMSSLDSCSQYNFSLSVKSDSDCGSDPVYVSHTTLPEDADISSVMETGTANETSVEIGPILGSPNWEVFNWEATSNDAACNSSSGSVSLGASNIELTGLSPGCAYNVSMDTTCNGESSSTQQLTTGVCTLPETPNHFLVTRNSSSLTIEWTDPNPSYITYQYKTDYNTTDEWVDLPEMDTQYTIVETTEPSTPYNLTEGCYLIQLRAVFNCTADDQNRYGQVVNETFCVSSADKFGLSGLLTILMMLAYRLF